MNTYKDFHREISKIENECYSEVIALFEEHNVSSIELDTEDENALILPMYGRYDGIENVTINSIDYKLVEVYGSEKMHIILGVEGYKEKFSLHEFDGNAILFVYDVVYNYFNNNK